MRKEIVYNLILNLEWVAFLKTFVAAVSSLTLESCTGMMAQHSLGSFIKANFRLKNSSILMINYCVLWILQGFQISIEWSSAILSLTKLLITVNLENSLHAFLGNILRIFQFAIGLMGSAYNSEMMAYLLAVGT